jgi:hypothetical protein
MRKMLAVGSVLIVVLATRPDGRWPGRALSAHPVARL